MDTPHVRFRRESPRGDEKGEAQVFLDRLFKALGHEGLFEGLATLEERVARRSGRGTAFADWVWKPRVLAKSSTVGNFVLPSSRRRSWLLCPQTATASEEPLCARQLVCWRQTNDYRYAKGEDMPSVYLAALTRRSRLYIKTVHQGRVC